MFADEFDGGVWADFGDWVKVVTTEEDAEVDELGSDMLVNRQIKGISGWCLGVARIRRHDHTCFLSIARPSRTLSR